MFAAEARETSCSAERPPNRIATLVLCRSIVISVAWLAGFCLQGRGSCRNSSSLANNGGMDDRHVLDEHDSSHAPNQWFVLQRSSRVHRVRAAWGCGCQAAATQRFRMKMPFMEPTW